jgi:uracil phosphoribosyltransferase
MIFNLSETNSIANRFIAELRDVEIQKNRMHFRRNLERLAEILAFQLSTILQYELKEIETPLGIAEIALPKDRIVAATILRAGLPFHQGILNYFDQADCAFISAYRKHHKGGNFEINVEYVSCPDLQDSVLIIADPMLATGSSINIAIRELSQYGVPKSIHVVTAIASAIGVDNVLRFHEHINIWAGAIDDELTAKSYIVPGLGDAGDLAYGDKLQE